MTKLRKGDRVVISVPNGGRHSYGRSVPTYEGTIVGESRDKTCWLVKRDQYTERCAYHKDYCKAVPSSLSEDERNG